VLALWAKLQGMLQAAGSRGYYYKVLTGRFVPDPRSLSLVFGRFVLGVPRSSSLFFGRFVLGVPRSLSLVFGYFVLGVLFLILVPSLFVPGVLFLILVPGLFVSGVLFLILVPGLLVLSVCRFWRFILVFRVVSRCAANSK
jgi:hypothetical protein